jgi:predicted phosphodiesterase
MNQHFREDGIEYTESVYRKQYATAKMFYEDGVFNKFSEKDYLGELDSEKRELEMMKVQYRDERNAWQRQNYSTARISQTLDKLADSLKASGRVQFEPHDTISINSDNDMVVLLSDLHIGEKFDNYYGTYDSDIARYRLGTMLDRVLEIAKENNSRNCHVFLLGDCISGNFRRSIQIENRENVIDQIKIAGELISSFCYELTKNFNFVEFYSVAGNHSRFQLKKDDDVADERLDDIVSWAVEMKLDHIENFKVPKSNIDNSMAIADIYGKLYVLVHGDNGDPTNDTEALKIMSAVNRKPYAICCGHLHTNNFSDSSGIKVIRGGSLCGSGNQFTREHKFVSAPEQMVATVDCNGIRALYPIVFTD